MENFFLSAIEGIVVKLKWHKSARVYLTIALEYAIRRDYN
jgi:hypothetical protein